MDDKFKLNYDGATLTTITAWWNGSRTVTRLENFHLPDPRSVGPAGVVKVGELELAKGESLFATRFDGDRVYVVTFMRIDPLWVVDLSDPARPVVAGHVEVSGYSTYIEPLGDRLVTVGVETNRVAVSLFDVHDPVRPVLLDKVPLGQNYSWSEANYNEKSFSVLQDQGLILVPFQGDTTNGYSSQVQLIDLGTDSLAARGLITHQFQPRRTAAHQDRILSISSGELIVVDATDRDHPEVRADLELAWSVDRLFIQGDYLLEVSTGNSWYMAGAPVVRVAAKADPDTILGELVLTNWPVQGASMHDGRLYLAQMPGSYGPLPLAAADATGTNPPAAPLTNLVVTVVDLGSLPDLDVSGQVAVAAETLPWWGSLKAVWPAPNLLVWVGGGENIWWYALDAVAVGDARLGAPGFWPFYGGNGGNLIAFDVSDSANPVMVSEVKLPKDSVDWWNFSEPYVAEGLVYISGQTSGWWIKGRFLGPLEAGDTEPTGGTNTTDSGVWVSRDYLYVVDFSDPAAPLVREAVNVPGQLKGLSAHGDLLYTTGYHWSSEDSQQDWTEWLDASAYDGVAAHLVDSLPLSQGWPHPVLAHDRAVFVGRPEIQTATNSDLPELQLWSLSDAGKFELETTVPLDNSANVLAAFGDLLAGQEWDGTTVLWDVSDPAHPDEIGRSAPRGCFWFDLNQATGGVADGLWAPLGLYGVLHVETTP